MKSFFQGPLPPPNILAEYEKISTGLAGRITAMAEENGKHRRKMEGRMLNAAIVTKSLGQILAFIVVLAGIIAGVYLLMNDRNVYGFISILLPLGAVAFRFVKPIKSESEKSQVTKKRQE